MRHGSSRVPLGIVYTAPGLIGTISEAFLQQAALLACTQKTHVTVGFRTTSLDLIVIDHRGTNKSTPTGKRAFDLQRACNGSQ